MRRWRCKVPQFSSQRTIDPTMVTASVTFNEQDIADAFFNQQDPDEQLFFDLYSPQWNKLKISEKLSILAKVAALGEPKPQATTLNVSLGQPQPK